MYERPGINSVQTNNIIFVKYMVYVVTKWKSTQIYFGEKKLRNVKKYTNVVHNANFNIMQIRYT